MTYIDILLILLLSFTLYYCRLLLTRLNTMQINNAKFALINNELINSINLAETNIYNLKQASQQAQKQINDAIVEAQVAIQKSSKFSSVNTEKLSSLEHEDTFKIKNLDNSHKNNDIKDEKHKEISDILARFDASLSKQDQ